jgi:ATP-dependent RNA helicase RhlE
MLVPTAFERLLLNASETGNAGPYLGLIERIVLTNFDGLGLIQPLMRALTAANYDVATPIQLQAIPLLLTGYDLMGCAQTGTGKTAAFALPTLQRLAATAPAHADSSREEVRPSAGPDRRGPRPIRCLVLAPTRELAAQIEKSFTTYGKYLNLRVAVIHGGVSQMPQARALQRGVDILVATPGRLLDLMNQRIADISNVEVLVIDEADQMFDMGFLRDLKKIVAKVPLDRQTLMFSATMPDEIKQLAKQWLFEPKHVEVARVSSAATAVSQSVFHVSAQNKPKLLVSYIKSAAVTRSIVFTRTKHGADQLVKILVSSGIDAVAIHGNKSQNARTRNLEAFKSERPPILVATDIAARGIDVHGVSHVINYQMPEVPEVYVHRIGRTARAGAAGTAVSFCAPDERGSLQEVERLINNTIEVNESLSELTLSAALQSQRPTGGVGKASGSGRSSSGRSGNSRGTSRPRSTSRGGASGGRRGPRQRKSSSGNLVMN